MGAAQSWLCGSNLGREDNLLQSGSRHTNGFTHTRELHAASLRPVIPSTPQMIKLQGPSYSSGSLEAKYEMLDEIGHGGTSVVYKCRERRSGIVRACKIIDRRAVEKEHNGAMRQLQVEIQVLQSLKHPNIIRIEDVYLSGSKICMVTEYMGGGELFDYVVDRGTLSEVEASTIVRQITSAVDYLHTRGIIHRDLKPENIMLTSKSRGADVKIIDFGLAKLLDADGETASFLGTRGYLAPEMLQRQAYSMSVDMWALGIIVYILLCGCLPFDDESSKIANDKAARARFGLRFPRWANGLSESAKDLLRQLLEVDSANRYSAEQTLAHPWVTGARTSNKYLKSPNYLRTIKQEQVREKMNSRANGMHVLNGNSAEVCNNSSLSISVRRQSR
uniref:Protein kinase domain-containing protein n=1 Tax=Peronospora matthiolae TaxID=2874970 RepID=A0AAV1V326_9STRA